MKVVLLVTLDGPHGLTCEPVDGDLLAWQAEHRRRLVLATTEEQVWVVGVDGVDGVPQLVPASETPEF